MPKADKLLDVRVRLDDGFILAPRLWLLPSPLAPSRHRYKYALFYGRPSERIVLFDDERGKGDHRHILEVESAYAFSTPEQLVEDFQAAVRAIQEGESR